MEKSLPDTSKILSLMLAPLIWVFVGQNSLSQTEGLVGLIFVNNWTVACAMQIGNKYSPRLVLNTLLLPTLTITLFCLIHTRRLAKVAGLSGSKLCGPRKIRAQK